MKKNELREAATLYVKENLKFEKGEPVEVVIAPDQEAFGKALKRECKRLGAGEVTIRVEQEVVASSNDDVLLAVKNLKKYFVVDTNFFGQPTKYLRAVDDVSFTLKKGKTLGIVGESGCGKTTMGRTILRLYNATGGEVWFKGREVSRISEKAFDKLRPNMQMIFQDPYASLSPRLTVGEIIGEAARQHGLVDKASFRDYVLKVMKMNML